MLKQVATQIHSIKLLFTQEKIYWRVPLQMFIYNYLVQKDDQAILK